MKLLEIYDYLNEISPFELQEKWDNSGLIVGDFGQEITDIALSIDVDEKLIDSLENNTLLITHHPLIFSGLKELNFAKYPANLLEKMVQKNISNIAMHTNFDQTHLNDYVAKEVLGQEITKKDGFVAYFDIDEEFEVFARRISEAFGLEIVRTVACHKRVRRVALTTGSGCSLMKTLEADCFLTGDIKYHQAYEAKENGLSMIEIGHFESEMYFADSLRENLKNFDIQAIIANSKNPFIYL